MKNVVVGLRLPAAIITVDRSNSESTGSSMQQELFFSADLEVEQSCITCPYLGDREARLVYWLPQGTCSAAELDRRLQAGQRRHGELVYEPRCHSCQECISLRVPVAGFCMTRSQRRVWKRGRSEIIARIGRPAVDSQRLKLINRHSHWRGWMREEGEVSAEFYHQIFMSSRFDSYEISYYKNDRLVGIAVCDLGQEGVSAVYTFYDPTMAKLSLGTYSVLFQIAWCQQLNLKYLYLGYYVADCRSLQYKARFLPDQRRMGGQWIDFADNV